MEKTKELLLKRYEKDIVNYYFFKNTNFTPESFVETINFDLVNDLSNLMDRVLKMIDKYADGIIPNYNHDYFPFNGGIEFSKSIFDYMDEVDIKLLKGEQSEALTLIWKLFKNLDQAILEFQPWFVEKDINKKEMLDSFLYYIADSMRIAATMLYDMLPDTTIRIFNKLGLESGTHYVINENVQVFEPITSGIRIPTNQESLFQYRNMEQEIKELNLIFTQ